MEFFCCVPGLKGNRVANMDSMDNTNQSFATRKPHKFARQPTRRPSTLELEATVPVVIIFTDIQDSTRLWQTIPDVMPSVLEMHDACMRSLINKHHGYEVKTEGDAFMISFSSAHDAVEFAAELQPTFLKCNWPAEVLKQPSCTVKKSDDTDSIMWRGPRIRVGIHLGPAIRKEVLVTGLHGGRAWKADFFGQAVNLAARVSSLASGGQTLVTKAFKDQVDLETPDALRHPWSIVERGEQILKGIGHPVPVYELRIASLAGRHFAPFKSIAETQQQQAVLEAMLNSKAVGGPMAAPGDVDSNPGSRVDQDQTMYEFASLLFTIVLTSYASQGDYQHIKALLSKNPTWDKSMSDYDRRTPLHLAACSGSVECVNLLVDSGVQINPRDRWGNTPLDDARRHKLDEVAELLISRGHPETTHKAAAEMLIDLALVPTRLCHSAASGDLEELTSLLKEHPTEISVGDYDQRTALHVAVCRDQSKAVSILLAHGASAHVKDLWNNSPIDDAKRLKRTKILPLLEAAPKPTSPPSSPRLAKTGSPEPHEIAAMAAELDATIGIAA